MSSGPVITGAGASYAGVAGTPGASSSTYVTKDDPVVVSLLVILTVVCAAIWSYYWCSPICRSLCRRWRCCCCQIEPDTDSESGAFASSSMLGARSTETNTRVGGLRRPAQLGTMGTPTLILLPHGRMLVVDGTIFAQLRAENTGLDLVELGESVMRNTPSQCSVIEMDAETPSKDSMGSLGCFPPPTYESIYGKDDADGPPSYSDILLHRYANLLELEMQHRRRSSSKEEIELRSLDNCPHIISNPMSSTSYPYPSSQSLPRNPSLIANPLDTYYVDNELAAAQRPVRQPRNSHRNHRRTRRTSLNGVDDAESSRTRRHSRKRRRSRAGSEERPAIENNSVQRFPVRDLWDLPSRPPNEFMNFRNIARSDSIRSVDIDESSSINPGFSRSQRSEDSIDAEPVRVHRNSRIDSEEINWNLNLDLDVRFNSDEERADLHGNEAGAEEDPNNFKVLADIRESRV